jgi:hypothetical protein
MKRHIPVALSTLRLLLGPFALLCELSSVRRLVYLPILVVGRLSDIFDGILARRFGVATPNLRQYGSMTDVIYYLFILTVAYIMCRLVVVRNIFALALLLSSEVIVVLASFAFRKVSRDALMPRQIPRPLPVGRRRRPAGLHRFPWGDPRINRRRTRYQGRDRRHPSRGEIAAGGRTQHFWDV